MLWNVHKTFGKRRLNRSSVALGTRIFTFGGYWFGSDLKISVHVLDTEKLIWHKLGRPDHQEDDCVPHDRCYFTTVAYGSKIYLWGGHNGRDDSNNVLYCFDTDTLIWSIPDVYGNIPQQRSGHSACIVEDSMYIFGGYRAISKQYVHDVYKLDLHTMTWCLFETTGTPPLGRNFHSATVMNNKMFIFGGYTGLQFGNEVYCSTLYYLDINTKKWIKPEVQGPRPAGRRNHSVFVHNDHLYMIGGCKDYLDINLKYIHQYDPENCTWKRLIPNGEVPVGRKSHFCLVVNNKVYVSCSVSKYPSSLSASTMELLLVGLTDNYFSKEVVKKCKAINELHVLNLKPDLKDLCLVSACDFLKSKTVPIEDLEIPSTIKDQLLAFIPTKNDHTLPCVDA